MQENKTLTLSEEEYEKLLQYMFYGSFVDIITVLIPNQTIQYL